MCDSNRQFVVLPHFGNLSDKKIKYTDALTYIAVRSFDGFHGCFPSYETIASRAGCSRDFVIKSIKRLNNAELINVKRGKMTATNHTEVNRYSFIKQHMFEQIPLEVFDLDLTLHDKAMLVTLRQFFRNSKMDFGCDIQKVAERLGTSYKIVYSRVTSLIEKGYICISKSRCSKYEFTDIVNWIWDYGNAIKLETKKEEPLKKLLIS